MVMTSKITKIVKARGYSNLEVLRGAKRAKYQDVRSDLDGMSH